MCSPTDSDHSATGDSLSAYHGTRSQRVLEDLRRRFARRERAIWLLVFVVLLADLALTLFGFQLGLDESNPLAVWLLQRYGVAGIVGLKLGVLGMAVVFRRLISDDYGVIVPVSLVLPWGYAVLVNLIAIATTL